MGLFSNDTSYNPLFLEDLHGLDADIAEAALEDETRLMKAKKEARKAKLNDMFWGGSL